MNKKGFTLIEILLVFAIIAALSISSFFIFNSVKTSNIVKIETDNINNIYANIKTIYASRSTYEKLTTYSVAHKTGSFKEGLDVKWAGSEDETIRWGSNMSGGYITVDASRATPTDIPDSSFTIAYTSVPSEICVKLILNVQSLFYNIYIDKDNPHKMPDNKILKNKVKSENGKINKENLTSLCGKDEYAVISFLAL